MAAPAHHVLHMQDLYAQHSYALYHTGGNCWAWARWMRPTHSRKDGPVCYWLVTDAYGAAIPDATSDAVVFGLYDANDNMVASFECPNTRRAVEAMLHATTLLTTIHGHALEDATPLVLDE